MGKRPFVPTTTLFFGLLVLAVAFMVYGPILRVARGDLAARKRAGLSNSVVYALLLFPILGPLLYVVLRKRFLPRS